MLHDLIKAANRNLAPGADPEADWLKYSDDSCITREEMEDAEFIEIDEEDEYEECEVCEEDEEDEETSYVHLMTTANDLGWDDTLETIEDSEVLEDFIKHLAKKLGYKAPKQLLSTPLEELDFISFEEYLNGDIEVQVETYAFIEYLEN